MFVKQSTTYSVDNASFKGVDGSYTVDHTTRAALQRYRESTPNPKYKQIIKDEGNATTPLFAYEQYVKIHPGAIFVKNIFGNTWNDTWANIQLNQPQSLYNLSLYTNPLVNDAVAKATFKTYEAIAKYQSPFNGQVFSGELKEVIDLIRHPFQKSAKLTDAVLRQVSFDGLKLREVKRFKGRAERITSRQAKNTSKASADVWLEYQFAVKPLLNDIADLFKLAADIAEKRDHETVRGYGKTEDVIVSAVPTSYGQYEILNERTQTSRVENVIRAGMTARFLDMAKEINSRNSFIDSIDDFVNVPVTAWELVPFSFLVDYFVNVGQLIQSAVVSQSGISYVSNSLIRTYEIKEKNTGIGAIQHPYLTEVYTTHAREVASGIRSVDRTSTLLGIPPVVFHLPGSNIRYANITALLTKFIT